MSKTIHCKNGLELVENRYGFVKISKDDEVFHLGVSKGSLEGMSCAEILTHCLEMKISYKFLNDLHLSSTSPVTVL